MAYLVLAYPNISKSDYDFIQGIRKSSDPKYFNLVEPHVTLVFSTDKLKLEEFENHIKQKIQNTEPFNLVLDKTKVVEDDSKTFFHAFLIPSEGFNEINKLHDDLYEDSLESELRQDIPFIPHLGIGTGTEEEMEKLANKLEPSKIIGSIEKVSIVEYDGNKVIDLKELSLGS